MKKAEAAAAAAKEYAASFHQEAHRNWMPHWLDERINEVVPFLKRSFVEPLMMLVFVLQTCVF